MSKETFRLVAEPGTPTIVMTRQFAAPRRLVFEAMTEPKHLRRWWGLRSLELVVCEVDLRVGGAYRYVLRAPNGEEYGFRGEYREIVVPERTVCTYVFEPMPEHPSVVTVVLEESGGKTTMTETIVHQSVQARDGHLQSGMEPGMRETLDRLDELLATMM